jgi:hypothetical protein
MPTSVDVNVNFRLTIKLEGPIEIVLVQPKPENRPAVATRLILGGTMPAGSITVDTTNETVTLQFVDDKGDATDAPAGSAISFQTSDPNVATVAADPNNQLQGNITPVGVGTVQVSAVVTGANDPSGNPLPNPDPVSLNVNPGAPVGERLVLATQP